MTMEAELKSRIVAYLTTKQISVYELSRLAKLPQTTLNKQINGDTALSGKVLEAICVACPDLSAEWLLRGEGTMYIHKAEGKTYNIYRTGGDGDGQTNVVGEGNELSSDSDALKMLIQQNQQLINHLIGGK